MPTKIRLQRRGRKKRPFYHIVIADGRAPRDGKYIESIGTYNPITTPATIELNHDKAFDWLRKGAQPTETVKTILKYKGVMYRLHLAKGVAKGALTQEQADAKLESWIKEKEARIESKVNEAQEKQKAEETKRFEAETKIKEERAKAIAERKAKAVEEEVKARAAEAGEENTEEEKQEEVVETPEEKTEEPKEE